jgi:hypothetical protein
MTVFDINYILNSIRILFCLMEMVFFHGLLFLKRQKIRLKNLNCQKRRGTDIYPQSVLKLFGKKSVLNLTGLNHNTIQARLTISEENKSRSWVNPVGVSSNRIRTDWLLTSKNLKQNALYAVGVVNGFLLINLPNCACKVIEAHTICKKRIYNSVLQFLSTRPLFHWTNSICARLSAVTEFYNLQFVLKYLCIL